MQKRRYPTNLTTTPPIDAQYSNDFKVYYNPSLGEQSYHIPECNWSRMSERARKMVHLLQAQNGSFHVQILTPTITKVTYVQRHEHAAH